MENNRVIRLCAADELLYIGSVINDGAVAYSGVIPADRFSTPYMSDEYLRSEMSAGVVFWGYERAGVLAGVMGIQDVKDVTLIRHAYVRTAEQGKGIGASLLAKLRSMTNRPILIGAWADATWAIQFYRRHGFEVVSAEEKTRLLRTYWTVPERQVETSVVLADDRWRTRRPNRAVPVARS